MLFLNTNAKAVLKVLKSRHKVTKMTMQYTTYGEKTSWFVFKWMNNKWTNFQVHTLSFKVNMSVQVACTVQNPTTYVKEAFLKTM